MDHFGPFQVQRKKEVSGIILICLTSGAVHIKTVESLNDQSHLNALDQFIARHGKPARIRSHNSKTFVFGAKEFESLTKAVTKEKFQNELATNTIKKWGIEFCFNLEYTPEPLLGKNGGRVQEGSTKVNGFGCQGCQADLQALVTILVQAKGLINQGLLVIDDNLRVITPMQLLQPTSSAAFGFETMQSIPRIQEQVRQGVEHFWRHWLLNYLTLMSLERHNKANPKFITWPSATK